MVTISTDLTILPTLYFKTAFSYRSFTAWWLDGGVSPEVRRLGNLRHVDTCGLQWYDPCCVLFVYHFRAVKHSLIEIKPLIKKVYSFPT